jgi:hypothetical protein
MMNPEIKILGLIYLFRKIMLEELGHQKYLPQSLEAAKENKVWPHFEKLSGLFQREGIHPVRYFKALADFVKTSKKFPTVFAPIVASQFALDCYRRWEHNQLLKFRVRENEHTFAEMVVSDVLQSEEIVSKMCLNFGLERAEVIDSMETSVYFKLTDETYLSSISSLSSGEERAAQRLMSHPELLNMILKAKENYK